MKAMRRLLFFYQQQQHTTSRTTRTALNHINRKCCCNFSSIASNYLPVLWRQQSQSQPQPLQRRRLLLQQSQQPLARYSGHVVPPNINPFNSIRMMMMMSSSSWTGVRGHDITFDSLTMSDAQQLQPPKIILKGYSSSGFDVLNVIKKFEEEDQEVDDSTRTRKRRNDSNEQQQQQQQYVDDGTIHMTGSILVFPRGCFLWKGITNPNHITLESLAPIFLHHPRIEYLFLGFNTSDDSSGSTSTRVSMKEMNRLRRALQIHGIIMEQGNISNAMGTFNFLNAEDRNVAAALVSPQTNNDD